MNTDTVPAICLSLLLIGAAVAVATPATADQESVSVSIQPADGDAQSGDEQTYELVVTGASSGVGSYDALITARAQNEIEITDVQAFNTSDGLFETEYSDHTHAVELTGLVSHDPDSKIVLARFDVDVSGVGGEATLGLSVNELNDQQGSSYAVESVEDATVTNGGDEESSDDENSEGDNSADDSEDDDSEKGSEDGRTSGDVEAHVLTFTVEILIEMLTDRLPV